MSPAPLDKAAIIWQTTGKNNLSKYVLRAECLRQLGDQKCSEILMSSLHFWHGMCNMPQGM